MRSILLWLSGVYVGFSLGYMGRVIKVRFETVFMASLFLVILTVVDIVDPDLLDSTIEAWRDLMDWLLIKLRSVGYWMRSRK